MGFEEKKIMICKKVGLRATLQTFGARYRQSRDSDKADVRLHFAPPKFALWRTSYVRETLSEITRSPLKMKNYGGKENGKRDEVEETHAFRLDNYNNYICGFYFGYFSLDCPTH